MRRMIWLFGLTCWATLYAQQVAFERGFYSFEAIAKALSVGGRQVLCEPTLKQRMALLSLKARDWEAMRQLLQKGLDLEIVCVDEERNQWRLQRDRQVVAREKQLRTRLAEVIEARWSAERQVREQILSLLSRVPAGELEAFRTWRDMYLSFDSPDILSLIDILPEEEFSKHVFIEFVEKYGVPDCPTLISWAREQAGLPPEELLRRFGTYLDDRGIMLSLDEEMRAQYILLSLSDLILDRDDAAMQVWRSVRHNLPLRQMIQRAIEQGEAIEVITLPPSVRASFQHLGEIVFPSSPAESEAGDVVSIRDYAGNVLALIPPYTVVFNCSFSWSSLYFSSTLCLFSSPSHEPLFLPLGGISISLDNLADLFKELDASLHNQYVEATKVHLQLIQNPHYQTPVNLRVKERRLGREIMYTGGLYLFLDRFARQFQQEIMCEVYPHRDSFLLRFDKVSLAQVSSSLSSAGVWRVEQVDGIWVWRNWLAFVDCVPELPLAAIYQLSRSQYNLSDWRRFVQQITLTQARWLNQLPVSLRLFGGETHFVVDGSEWALLRLLESVPFVESNVQQTVSMDYSLSKIPAFVLRRFATEVTPGVGLPSGGAIFSNSPPWARCVWYVMNRPLVDNLAEVLQKAGRLRIKKDDKTRELECVVLLGDKLFIHAVLPINQPKQK